jgi:hypothetical protein
LTPVLHFPAAQAHYRFVAAVRYAVPPVVMEPAAPHKLGLRLAGEPVQQ